MAHRGHDQLTDSLLMSWWWGKWESASLTFLFQLVFGLHACGQHTVNFCPHYLCVFKSLSCIWPFATPWTVAYQTPLPMGFSRQEYQSGLTFPSPGNLPNPGTKPGSLAWQADSLVSEPPGKLQKYCWVYPLTGTKILPQGCTTVSFDCTGLVSASLP